MKLNKIQLPSNKKFGYFFSGIFLIVSLYFLYSGRFSTGYIFVTLAILFILITIIKADLLLPLNKLWMYFGFFLGIIISPIVLGIIFFGLFTPYSLVMRLMGRDELRLRKTNKKSYWIIRSKSSPQTNFKQQF